MLRDDRRGRQRPALAGASASPLAARRAHDGGGQRSVSQRARSCSALKLPDVDVWSPRVTVALGQNPSLFTGPGTNTYLVGTGPRADPARHRARACPPTCPCSSARSSARAASASRRSCSRTATPITSAACAAVLERYGAAARLEAPARRSSTRAYAVAIDADRRRRRGAHRGRDAARASTRPATRQDHLCFVLEEEHALFSGDNVLGVGTTVIPTEGGDLLDYMSSLERLLAEAPARDLSGARAGDRGRRREAARVHRAPARSASGEILAALGAGRAAIPEIVALVYAAYPDALHAAARAVGLLAPAQARARGPRARAAAATPLAARWARCA